MMVNNQNVWIIDHRYLFLDNSKNILDDIYFSVSILIIILLLLDLTKRLVNSEFYFWNI